MATVKKPTNIKKRAPAKRAPDAKQVQTISNSGATVNLSDESKTSETVTVLFRSRQSQTFILSGNREVTINGNAVYLANAMGGALPSGGYGMTIIDRADWEEIKARYGKTYAGWFRSGRLQVRDRQQKAVNYAIDHADDKTGDDPISEEE